MSFTQDPIFIAATLCISVFFANWLTRFPWGKTICTPILVILLCAQFSNVGIIHPSMKGGL